MRSKNIAVFLTLFWLVSAQAETLEFQVSGEARIENSDTTEARNQAIVNAIDSALSMTLERFLPVKVISENRDLLAQRIFAKKLGYMDRLEVTGFKTKNGALKTYSIEASIGIAGDNLENDLEALGLMAFREKLPKVMTVIQEKNIDNVHWHFQDRTANNAEAIIWKIFDLSGFFSGPQAQLLESITQEIEQDLYADNLKRIAQIGAANNVDIVITGKAISRPVVTLEVMGDSASAVAMVTLNAIRCADGQELATSSTSATTAGLSDAEAGASAISKATEEAALNMMPKFMEKWEEAIEPVIEITMYVSGLKSIESLVQFKNEFVNTIPGIKSFERRTFSGGAAAYDIVSTTDVKTMVELLNRQGLKSFKAEVRSSSENSMDLKLKME